MNWLKGIMRIAGRIVPAVSVLAGGWLMTSALLAGELAAPGKPAVIKAGGESAAPPGWGQPQVPAALDAENVVWDTPSENSAGSMPLGNGEVVVNAWVEKTTGDLLLLLARTDALSEAGRFLKLGRLRLHLEGAPLLKGGDFRQELRLREGVVAVLGGGVSLRVFVDCDAHVLHIDGESKVALTATATVENWRDSPREMLGDDLSCWSLLGNPLFGCVESADVFLPAADHSVVWYHRNETSAAPKLLENQSLTGAKGAVDPLLHRTFGGLLTGSGFSAGGARTIRTAVPQTRLDLRLATHSAQTATVAGWRAALQKEAEKSEDAAAALARTRAWWGQFWGRSYVFVSSSKTGLPANDLPLRVGVDASGQSRFPGAIEPQPVQAGAGTAAQAAAAFAAGRGRDPATFEPTLPPGEAGFTLMAWINPSALVAGRIFDKCTPGGADGFLLDTYPGHTLRLVVGDQSLSAPASCLQTGRWQHVAATVDGATGAMALYLDGKPVAASGKVDQGETITRSYILQRYAQGFQGRGAYPIKFNGGFFCVEPHIGSVYLKQSRPDADWRAWGDCYWWQNTRHMYHPMLACGDFDLMEPLFRMYGNARPLAEARTAKYHGAEGVYFPETMTVFGSYAGCDYGWDRKNKEPRDVNSLYIGKIWNPGVELVALMLDRWDYTQDEEFLVRQVLPMAVPVLRYFDTRFPKDAQGKLVISPAQAVETYWTGVVNDLPTVAGIANITRRLCTLPPRLATSEERAFFGKMRAACPAIPMETVGGMRKFAPAEKYNPKRDNCENPETYAIWPYREASLLRPEFLAEGKAAYARRGTHLPNGWGYDGNCAALLGLTDEAARILKGKCSNSNRAYRWPATWGPNFDWLPDQNHGGNLLETANLMLLQAEADGRILLLPAWPQKWDVDFKLHAPLNTTVECRLKDGKITKLKVLPESRRREVVVPAWADVPRETATSKGVDGAALAGGQRVAPVAGLAGAGRLAADFISPPMSARPFVFWHWMGADFSQAGITRDLEAMKEAGIGGAEIFNLGSEIANGPWPGQAYRGKAYWDALRHTLAEARRLGLEIALLGTPGYSTTGGPWINLERGMQKVVWSITEADGGKELSLTLPALAGGALAHPIAVLAVPRQEHLSVRDLIDISSQVDAAGRLNWQAPGGKWRFYRFGYAPTGKAPHPIPEDLVGHTFEADKMSREVSRFNWGQVIDPIRENLGEFIGHTLRAIAIDSYESGEQNWTPNFRAEFIQRKGYDPVPWLVTLGQPLVHSWFFDANRQISMYQLIGPTTYATELPNPSLTVLGSLEETRRFEWDYRDVISGLFFENGWQVAHQMVNHAGLEFWQECYRGPFDRNQGVTASDIPMCEFWTEKGNVNAPSIFTSDTAAAQAAGKTIVAAEALTGGPNASMWTEDPAGLKIFGDEAFAQGINKLMLHHWTLQPFDDRYQPGRTMFAWGTHFGRHQTWFEPGKAYFAYLGRCQTLLQYGERVIDSLALDQQEGESDVIAKEVFLQSNIKVIDGKIALPSGRRYAFMVFPRDGVMLPEVAMKIKALVAGGATVVSTRPRKSPSLKDYPQAEEVLRQLGDEVWGTGAANRYGQGQIFSTVAEASAKLGLQPDYLVQMASDRPAKIMVLHRRKLDLDIYYVSNQSDKPQNLSLSFRVSGKQPELWQAEDGSITDAPVWHDQGDRTYVDIHLKGLQTVFVVFRRAASKAEHILAVNPPSTRAMVARQRNGTPVLRSATAVEVEVVYTTGRKRSVALNPGPPVALAGGWEVLFAPKLGQPFTRVFPELTDFSKSESKEVKYFSGSATYRRKLTVSASSLSNRRTVLDLGVVNDIAQVRVNGQAVGVLWYPPYTVDITDFLGPGDNDLEVVVTNNWANQLIGDEQEPRDFEVGSSVDWGAGSFGCQLKSYPDWFVKGQARPSPGRKTFTTWHYFTKDSPLKPAGLVGPVRLVTLSESDL